MGIGIFYLIAIIPAIVGGFMMINNRKVVWWEWLGGIAAGILISAVMHVSAVVGMTGDVETWSGKANGTVRYPFWMEKQTFTTTDDKGNTTTHNIYIPHPEYWTIKSELGELNLTSSEYEQTRQKFGAKTQSKLSYKPGFDSGDPMIYVTDNTTGYNQPVVDDRWWSNRVKAAPSVFSFAKVPVGTKVYPWPNTESHIQSTRIMGLTGDVDVLEFDRMNARLGPTKHVNVVLIGFGVATAEIAQWQKAAWLGGKKNDLVICFGGNPKKPTWVKVFGWTESDTCKYSLESLLMAKGVSNSVLPDIESTIKSQFAAKDWSKFDYLAIEPRPWHYLVLIVFMAASQIGWWMWACRNQYDKDAYNLPYRRRFA